MTITTWTIIYVALFEIAHRGKCVRYMRKHENENKRKYKTKFSVGLFHLCLSFAF